MQRYPSWSTQGAVALVVLIACALLVEEVQSTSTLRRGQAYYDSPDYDLGLNTAYTRPNEHFSSYNDRRYHRPSSRFYRQLPPPRRVNPPRTFDDPWGKTRFTDSMMVETDSHAWGKGHLANPPLRNQRFAPLVVPVHRHRHDGGQDPDLGLNNFYRFRQTNQMKTTSATEIQPEMDDPFGGPVPSGMHRTPVPTQVSSMAGPQMFQAPAFTEVMSQIKEIVASPRQPHQPTLSHMIASVIDQPMVAPPMAPPPVPLSLRDGPPLPALVETQRLVRPSIMSGFSPVKVVSSEPVGQNSLVETGAKTQPVAGGSQNYHDVKAKDEPAKMRFRLLPTPVDTPNANAAPAKPQRDPNAIPFVENNGARTPARAFIEEIAGVKKSAPKHQAIALPPPIVSRNKSYNKFRLWE